MIRKLFRPDPHHRCFLPLTVFFLSLVMAMGLTITYAQTSPTDAPPSCPPEGCANPFDELLKKATLKKVLDNGSDASQFTGSTTIGGPLSIKGLQTTTLKVTTGASDGKILTSDGAGSATWQDTQKELPTATNGQTLRYNGTNWVANSFFLNDGARVSIKTDFEVSNSREYSDTNQVISNHQTPRCVFDKDDNIRETPTTPAKEALRTTCYDQYKISTSGLTVKKSKIYEITFSNATTLIVKNGDIGIGKAEPGYKLDVNGIINATDIYKNGAPLMASQWITSGNNIHYTNGKVGIGTIDPKGTLQVNGTIYLHNLGSSNESKRWGIYAWDNTLQFTVRETDADWTRLSTPLQIFTDGRVEVRNGLYVGGDEDNFIAGYNHGKPLLFYTTAGGVNDYKAHMAITKDGKIGIGTNDPQGNVHVRWNSSIADSASIILESRSHTMSLSYGSDSTDPHLYFQHVKNGNTVTSNTPVIFNTNAPTRSIYLEASGNVAIGGNNSTPLQELHIKGNNSNADIRLENGQDGNRKQWNIGGGEKLWIASMNNGNYTYTDRLVIDYDSGNVGIGIRNPQFRLDVNGSINVAFANKTVATIENTQQKNDSLGMDVAELFESEDVVEEGEIVAVSRKGKQVKRSTSPYQKGLLGVVSSAPAILFEGSELKLAPDPQRFIKGKKPPIALAGRVLVKVSTENGSIEPGDYLTSSTIPGVAMKATDGGPTIGIALEKFDARTQDKILAFVNVGGNNLYGFVKEVERMKMTNETLKKRLEQIEKILKQNN